jgi:hypothetical protein
LRGALPPVDLPEDRSISIMDRRCDEVVLNLMRVEATGHRLLRRDHDATASSTTATTRFRAMMTYGQFAWFEPLRMTMMMFGKNEVVIVVEEEDLVGWWR